jgi:transcriptional regulator with XRE-family HTH domain
MSFGARFRILRDRAHLTQKQVAARLKYEGAAPVSLLERHNDKVPRAGTIVRYALALECKPSELLEDVETEYDRIKAGKYDDGPSKVNKMGEASAPITKRRRAS